MYTKTLEQQIKERKQEAKDKKISYKAFLIATELGELNSYERSSYLDYTYYNDYLFKQHKLTIEYNTSRGQGSDGGYGGSSLSIYYNNKVVFHNDESYIPGDWEQVLDFCFIRAEAKKQNKTWAKMTKEHDHLVEEEAKLKAKWGL